MHLHPTILWTCIVLGLSVIVHADRCREIAFVKCDDGVCRANADLCQVCDDNMKLCADGRCQYTWEKCPVVPDQRAPWCREDQDLCDDWTCEDRSRNCSLYYTDGPCDDTFEKRCPDGKCIFNFEDCDGCPSVGDRKCDDGTCLPVWQDCPNDPCPLHKVTCDNGDCADYEFDCPCSYGDRCSDGECRYDCNSYSNTDDFTVDISWWRFLGIPVMIVLVVAGAMCRLYFYRSHRNRAARNMAVGGAPTVVPASTSGVRPPAGSYPAQNYAPPPAYPAAGTYPPPPPAAGTMGTPAANSNASQFPATDSAYPPPNASGAYSNPGFANGAPSDLPPYPGPPVQAPSAPPPSYEDVSKSHPV